MYHEGHGGDDDGGDDNGDDDGDDDDVDDDIDNLAHSILERTFLKLGNKVEKGTTLC